MIERELVGVNREMSIIKVREIEDGGVSKVVDVNMNIISKEDFFNLCEMKVDTITEDFLAEVDVMLDESVNPEVRNDYTAFLVLRDRLVEKYLRNGWQRSGQEILNNEKSFYDKPVIELSDLLVYVNKTTNEVVKIVGVYTPEFFKQYSIDFDSLNDIQKLGFIQTMPKKFIDEKMFVYFYTGEGELDFCKLQRFTKQNIKDYKKLENKFDIDKVLKYFSENKSCLYDFALSTIYCEESSL